MSGEWGEACQTWPPVTDGDNTGGSIMGCVAGLVAVVVMIFLAALAIYLWRMD